MESHANAIYVEPMTPQQVRVLWRGVRVVWDQIDRDPDNGVPYVIVCGDDGHYIATEQLEIYIDGKLWFHSSDVWFPGMIKPY